MSDSENFTSRAARWAAAHRGAVILGWLAFVIAAFVLGSAAGVVQLKSLEEGNGQSRAPAPPAGAPGSRAPGPRSRAPLVAAAVGGGVSLAAHARQRGPALKERPRGA